MSDETAAAERASLSLVAVRPEGAPTVARHERTLVRGFDHYGPLIPVSDCRTIVAELQRQLQPIGLKRSASHARRCAGCWPTPPHDCETWIAAAVAELAPLPEDLARECVEILTTSSRWLPSRYEIHQVAARLLNRRTRMLATARAHLAEHECRAEEAARTARIAPVKAAIGDEWEVVVACQRERFRCLSIEAQDLIAGAVEQRVADGADFAEAARAVAVEIVNDPDVAEMLERVRAWRKGGRA